MLIHAEYDKTDGSPLARLALLLNADPAAPPLDEDMQILASLAPVSETVWDRVFQATGKAIIEEYQTGHKANRNRRGSLDTALGDALASSFQSVVGHKLKVRSVTGKKFDEALDHSTKDIPMQSTYLEAPSMKKPDGSTILSLPDQDTRLPTILVNTTAKFADVPAGVPRISKSEDGSITVNGRVMLDTRVRMFMNSAAGEVVSSAQASWTSQDIQNSDSAVEKKRRAVLRDFHSTLKQDQASGLHTSKDVRLALTNSISRKVGRGIIGLMHASNPGFDKNMDPQVWAVDENTFNAASAWTDSSPYTVSGSDSVFQIKPDLSRRKGKGKGRTDGAGCPDAPSGS